MAKKVDPKGGAKGGPLAPAEPSRAPVPVKKSGGKIAGKGFENLEREDLILPRIKLLQALSPEVEEGHGKPGDILLNLSNKVLGQKILIIPILHFRSRIKWLDKDDGGGIDCAAPNARVPNDTTKYSPTCAACPHKEWDNEQEKPKDQAPKCTLYENFLVLVGDGTEPMILPMERTKTKVARKAYSMMALKGGNMFENVYELSVTKEKNAKDEPYFNYVIKDAAKKTDPKRLAMCEQFWESLVSKDLTRSMEHPEVDGAAAGAPAGDGKY